MSALFDLLLLLTCLFALFTALGAICTLFEGMGRLLARVRHRRPAATPRPPQPAQRRRARPRRPARATARSLPEARCPI